MVCCWDESVFRKVFWREEKMSALFQISRAFFRQKSKSEAFRSKNDRYLLIFYHGSFIFLILFFLGRLRKFFQVTRENWQLTRVFPRAMQSPVCSLSPIWMWSSGREKSAWGERWSKSKLVIVGLKKRVKEIVLWISWPVWKKRTEVNLKDSRLRTSCSVQIYCQRLYWRAWLLPLICHYVSPHSSYSFSFSFEE